MLRVFLVIVLGAALAVAIGVGVVRWQGGESEPPASTGTPTPGTGSPTPEDTRRIRVNLFYVDADGLDLVPVEREVPYNKAVAEQARLILEEQLKPPQEPLGPIAPSGVTIRGFYLTESGDAFADFSSELATADVGGSLDEMLTVYALVNAVTINVPLVKTMQILVNGREVETLAGHIDLRRPLRRNTGLVKGARPAPPVDGAESGASPTPAATPSTGPSPTPTASAPDAATPAR